MSEELRQLEIAKITADPDVQPRVEVDDATVVDYHERMLANAIFPPVVVFDDGRILWLADGFHRIEAAKRAGRTKIDTNLLSGTRDDAIKAALKANGRHGKRLTNADKERITKRALFVWAGESNGSIANRINVSRNTVDKYRREMESGCQIDTLAKITGSDGKQYPARRDPTPPPPPPAEQTETLPPPPPAAKPEASAPIPPAPQPVASENTPPAPPPAPKPAATPTPPPPAEQHRDRVGNVLTDPRLIDAFKRDRELTELCNTVSKVKSAVLKACESGDLLYAHINTGAFEADANNMRRAISNTRPYAVCPYCRNGAARTSCDACLRRGWVNELRYKQAPKDMR